MRWKGREESGNVEDRRGMPAGKLVAGGGIGTLIIAVVVMLMGGDPSALLGSQTGPPTGGAGQQEFSAEEKERAEFVGVVLKDTEDVWNEQFKRMGKQYQEPNLVLFTGQVDSACGFASAAMGPFYCPEDSKVYIDLGFFDELSKRFGAPGEFAQAYVIAHEVGHHVQHLMGITNKVHSQRSRVSEKEYNQLSVRLELQADFLAGLWAHHAQKTKNILDMRDLEDALRAAQAIGDDTIQRGAQGHVVPESFTHGSAEQRMRWFKKGFDSGDIRQGDTFSTNRL